MKSAKRLNLPKRILSLVLSVILLAVIAYIPRTTKVNAELDYKDISVVKKWDDKGNEYMRPEDLYSIFILKADGGEVKDITPEVTPPPEAGIYEYTYTWRDLPRYREEIDPITGDPVKIEIEYSVEEVDLAELGYAQLSCSAQPKVKKTVDGMAEGDVKTFVFELYEVSISGEESLIDTKTLNTGNIDRAEIITFDPIYYYLNAVPVEVQNHGYIIIAQYIYIIKEVDPGKNWNIDKPVPDITVIVLVAYNSDLGTLEAFVTYDDGGDIKYDVLENGEPCLLKNIYTAPPEATVRVIKLLQDCDGDEIDLTGSYEVKLENDDGDIYLFELNSENNWGRSGAGQNIPEGIYYIYETSGGEDYDVSFSPVTSDADNINIIEIFDDGENEFVITVINKEKPKEEETTEATTPESTPEETTTEEPTPEETTPENTTTTTGENITTTTRSTTQSTTTTTTNTTQHTTESPTEPIIDRPEPTTQPVTEPTIESPTQPVGDSTESSIPIETETTTEELEDVDESIPLGSLELTEEETTDEEEMPENTVPLVNIPPTVPITEELKPNPQTEDSIAFVVVLFGVMIISGATMVVAKKKFDRLIK
ncbi:MAG: Cna B-type domain-containing protein [Oscillospiraceae bacterium]|nr:Cna B-type domain-containing protein [Oscillospiraceae bacterium]